jgi:hypothetical protein
MYVVGGDMAGHDLPKSFLEKDGEYGYLFEVDISGGDTQPDEDSVGELIYDEKAPWWLVNMFVSHVAPSRRERLKRGEYAYFASVGKQLLRLMSDAQKKELMTLVPNAAHHGEARVLRGWRFDKKNCISLVRDGSNFFEYAEEVPIGSLVTASTDVGEEKADGTETDTGSELTEADRAYLDAVANKDTAKALVLLAHRAAEAGYTVGPVYHGSPDLRFIQTDYAFKSLKERYGHGSEDGVHWFAKNYKTAKSYADDRRAFDYQNAEAGVYAAYLKIDNSLEVDAGGGQWRDAQRRGKTSDVIEQAKQEGKDSVVIRNVQDDYQTGVQRRTTPTTTYAVFSANRIKSAAVTYDDQKNPIPLSKRFDSSKKDIRY